MSHGRLTETLTHALTKALFNMAELEAMVHAKLLKLKQIHQLISEMLYTAKARGEEVPLSVQGISQQVIRFQHMLRDSIEHKRGRVHVDPDVLAEVSDVVSLELLSHRIR